MEIKILGTGCPNCITLENNTKIALQKMWIEAKVEKVTDIVDILSYNLMSTPWLVVDWKVVWTGKNLDVDTIINLIKWEELKQKEENNQKKWWCSCWGMC